MQRKINWIFLPPLAHEEVWWTFSFFFPRPAWRIWKCLHSVQAFSCSRYRSAGLWSCLSNHQPPFGAELNLRTCRLWVKTLIWWRMNSNTLPAVCQVENTFLKIINMWPGLIGIVFFWFHLLYVFSSHINSTFRAFASGKMEVIRNAH